MSVLALDTGEVTLWWIALALGAVVLAVVIVLLTLLSRLLGDVGSSVASLDEIAGRLERETPADALTTTATSLRDLRTEIKLHDDLLARWAQRSRSS